MRTYPITPKGLEAMKGELRRLLEEERPAAVKAIEEARGHGDLSENAEYDTAKDRQGMIEAKIRDLDAKLAMAQVIDPATLQGGRVMFGAVVHLEDVDTSEEYVYQLVGTFEADVKAGRISVESPIGKALMGKEVDDEVVIPVPRGKRTVVVTDVVYR